MSTATRLLNGTKFKDEENEMKFLQEDLCVLETVAACKLIPLETEEDQLRNSTHPDYVAGMKRLKHDYDSELDRIEIGEKDELERIEKAYQLQKELIEKEYAKRVSQLVETLYDECDEKKKMVDQEVNAMDITSLGTSADNFYHSLANRKALRRRANEHADWWDKRPRKHSPPNIVHLLPEAVIAHDVKLICKKSSQSSSINNDEEEKQRSVTLESNRLTFNGKLFHKSHNVMCETANYGRFPAVIQSICEQFVQMKSTVAGDTRQVSATKDDLESGRVIIKRKY